MLTNERLNKIANTSPDCGSIYPLEVIDMARELLSLRSLPAMAEVDALWKRWYECFDDSEDGRVEDLYLAACRAIANAESERKRAEEAEEAEKIIRELKDNFGAMETGA